MQTIEPCWKCGSAPKLEEKLMYGGELRFRYVCPHCKHKSTSVRQLRKEALVTWNRTAKMQVTKQAKKEMGCYE
jgi:predicted nucleic acid-binding Zn ribbon protein